MTKSKAIFMGTPTFAVPCLEKLNEHCDILAVITQPDRPKGRGQKLTASPVKEFAAAAGLPVLQPEKNQDTRIRKNPNRIKTGFNCCCCFWSNFVTADPRYSATWLY